MPSGASPTKPRVRFSTEPPLMYNAMPIEQDEHEGDDEDNSGIKMRDNDDTNCSEIPEGETLDDRLAPEDTSQEQEILCLYPGGVDTVGTQKENLQFMKGASLQELVVSAIRTEQQYDSKMVGQRYHAY